MNSILLRQPLQSTPEDGIFRLAGDEMILYSLSLSIRFLGRSYRIASGLEELSPAAVWFPMTSNAVTETTTLSMPYTSSEVS